jgi:hypothetical protein
MRLVCLLLQCSCLSLHPAPPALLAFPFAASLEKTTCTHRLCAREGGTDVAPSLRTMRATGIHSIMVVVQSLSETAKEAKEEIKASLRRRGRRSPGVNLSIESPVAAPCEKLVATAVYLEGGGERVRPAKGRGEMSIKWRAPFPYAHRTRAELT